MPLSNPLGFKHHPLEGAGLNCTQCSFSQMRRMELSRKIYTYMKGLNLSDLHVGKYSSPMEHMGL